MPTVVGLAFEEQGKIHFYTPAGVALRAGDVVVAETSQGPRLASVVLKPREMEAGGVPESLRPVLRVAGDDDTARQRANRRVESLARTLAPEKIRAMDLPMRFIDAEAAFEGGKLTVYFSAEGRVDFRDLVRVLSTALDVRVQMHQLGARDQAKMLGGVGSCGRELCCTTWMRSFEPISMRMAKVQSLFLNPSKFSGNCGKLKCCLRYEYDFYTEAHDAAPEYGTDYETPQGWGRVVEINVVKSTFTVYVPDVGRVEMKLNVKRERVGCGKATGEEATGGGCGGCSQKGSCGTGGCAACGKH